MRVLVTGGTGLLGYNLVKVLSPLGYDVYATHHGHEPPQVEGVKWFKLNLEEPGTVVDVLNTLKPNIIIHTAAYTDVDGCEVYKERAFTVNYIATRAIARQAAKHNIFLVYISTDYVFDGEKGLYKENDTPNPVNYYGLTKLLGEVAVTSTLDEKESLIVRISGLYGYSPTGKKNFGINALEKLLHGEEVVAFADQYVSPTYAYFLSERIAKAIEKRVHGVIHIAGQRMSRLEFAVLLARILRADEKLVKPATIKQFKFVARRPKDSSLDTSYAKSIDLDMPPQEECIKHLVDMYLREVKR
mgnify:CR=1 FL=1